MRKLLQAGLGAIGLMGAGAGAASAWDDSDRYCPGARGCPTAHYSLDLHRGPYYRYLPEYRQTYFYRHGMRRGRCVTRHGRKRCAW